LSIIGRLVGVLGGSGFLLYLVGWLGVTAVRCYGRVFFLRCIQWPLQVYCGGGVPLWCWYVRRASGFRDVIGMSLIERKKNYDKTHMAGYERKKKILKMLYIYVYACAYICICVVVMRPMYLHLM